MVLCYNSIKSSTMFVQYINENRKYISENRKTTFLYISPCIVYICKKDFIPEGFSNFPYGILIEKDKKSKTKPLDVAIFFASRQTF